MIPLRDINPTRRTPVVTWGLIAVVSAVWVYQLSGDANVIETWGLIPSKLTDDGNLSEYSRLVSAMFVHASWLHLLGNLWFLHVFGDNVEDALGRGPFLAFYFAGGLAASATQIAIDPSSTLPMVGASGAIAAVLGAYLVLYPHARVVALVFIFFAEVPAWLFLFVWFGLQLLDGVSSFGVQTSGGTAFFAHIGGFVAGLVMVFALRRSGGSPEHDNLTHGGGAQRT